MDDPFVEISNRINQVFQDTGRDIVADIKEEIGDGWPPASDPGEPPHLRSGDLQEGIDHIVEPDADRPRLEVASAMFYSSILEYGTGSRRKKQSISKRSAATLRRQQLSHPLHLNPEDPDQVSAVGLDLSSGGIAPRPFMGPAQSKWGPILVQRLQEKFT